MLRREAKCDVSAEKGAALTQLHGANDGVDRAMKGAVAGEREPDALLPLCGIMTPAEV